MNFLSPFLFLLAIDWIMKITTSGKKNGIQQTLWSQLDDLDFADDIALLSHSHQQMQDKSSHLLKISSQVGHYMHRGKTKILNVDTISEEPVRLDGKALEEV